MLRDDVQMYSACKRPADDHGGDDRLPAGVEELSASRVFGRDDHPHRSQRHEEGTHERRHVRVRV